MTTTKTNKSNHTSQKEGQEFSSENLELMPPASILKDEQLEKEIERKKAKAYDKKLENSLLVAQDLEEEIDLLKAKLVGRREARKEERQEFSSWLIFFLGLIGSNHNSREMLKQDVRDKLKELEENKR